MWKYSSVHVMYRMFQVTSDFFMLSYAFNVSNNIILRHVWNTDLFHFFLRQVFQILLVSIRDWCNYMIFISIVIAKIRLGAISMKTSNSLNTSLHNLIIINTTLYIICIWDIYFSFHLKNIIVIFEKCKYYLKTIHIDL